MSLADSLLAALPAAGPRWYEKARAQVYGSVQRDWAQVLCRDPGARRILDWGTGCGELPRALCGRGPQQVDAVDESDALLFWAEQRVAEEKLSPRPGFQLLERSGSPFPGPYDRVLCLGWRHATEPLARTLSRAYRRLAPGGELWWAELCAEDPAARQALHDTLLVQLDPPGWLPAVLWKGALRAALERLPRSDEVERAVQDSAFGLVLERRIQELPIGAGTPPHSLLSLRLRREELVS